MKRKCPFVWTKKQNSCKLFGDITPTPKDKKHFISTKVTQSSGQIINLLFVDPVFRPPVDGQKNRVIFLDQVLFLW